MQVALDSKSPIGHQHARSALLPDCSPALDFKSATVRQHLPTAWQHLPLSTGWSNYGIGYTVPQCRKFMEDLIIATFALRSGDLALGQKWAGI